MRRIDIFKRAIEERNCVKIIAGITNYKLRSVLKIVKAATIGGAHCVDVSARDDIIEAVRNNTDMVVFASSIKPKQLAYARTLGADVLEVGNFDVFYGKGKYYSAEEILDITNRTLDLVGDKVMMSVTVPGYLSIEEQVNLATQLEELGIDIIQSEGAALDNPVSPGALGLLQKAQPTLANTIELASNIKRTPIMTASGITPITAPMAIAAGASIVGIGSYINKLESEIEMIAAVRSIVDAVNSIKFVNHSLTVS